MASKVLSIVYLRSYIVSIHSDWFVSASHTGSVLISAINIFVHFSIHDLTFFSRNEFIMLYFSTHGNLLNGSIYVFRIAAVDTLCIHCMRCASKSGSLTVCHVCNGASALNKLSLALCICSIVWSILRFNFIYYYIFMWQPKLILFHQHNQFDLLFISVHL